MYPKGCFGLRPSSRVKGRQREGQARTVFWERWLAGLSGFWWEPGLMEMWLSSGSRRQRLPWIQTWLVAREETDCTLKSLFLSPLPCPLKLWPFWFRPRKLHPKGWQEDYPTALHIETAKSNDQIFDFWLMSDLVVLKFVSIWCKEPGNHSFFPHTYFVLS